MEAVQQGSSFRGFLVRAAPTALLITAVALALIFTPKSTEALGFMAKKIGGSVIHFIKTNPQATAAFTFAGSMIALTIGFKLVKTPQINEHAVRRWEAFINEEIDRF
ncbi:MAG: hypothetical protein SP1CHLAM54_11950 [Chlamydiia bacterium]|nr:hypothetical protein [Chlamydiia bacterium]MCH9616094.1 hypothetical protein [Chlamydiia bacterium]MCH9629483.1 hypothetical protein [Chlamydiia bacterium]